jgi:hypothetical protein
MRDFTERTNADMGAEKSRSTVGGSASSREVDWGAQDAYWRDNYGSRPYAKADRQYQYYQPAYKYGHEAAFLYGGRAWDDEVDHDLERGWDQARGDSSCTWLEVKDAVRDAYERTRPQL